MAANLVHTAETKMERLPSFLASKIRPRAPRLAAVCEMVHIDSPLTAVFILSSSVVHATTHIFPTFSTDYFAVPPWAYFRLASPWSWWRLVSHVLGHSSWSHLNGNVTNLLLVMPACERHFGTFELVKIIVWVSLASSIAHMALGPGDAIQLGASGVVFSMIILNSLIEVGNPGRTGRVQTIPLTFICQIFLWCWNEVISTLFYSGTGVSHIAHLVGAVVGTVAGNRLSNSKRR